MGVRKTICEASIGGTCGTRGEPSQGPHQPSDSLHSTWRAEADVGQFRHGHHVLFQRTSGAWAGLGSETSWRNQRWQDLCATEDARCLPPGGRGLHNPNPVKARRQVGARYVARARGAFGFADAKGTRNGASLGRPARRGANVAQHWQSLLEDSTVPARLKPVLKLATAPVQDAESTQATMQLAWLQSSLQRGRVLPGAQAEDTAAAR